jgi:hypothetical protein
MSSRREFMQALAGGVTSISFLEAFEGLQGAATEQAWKPLHLHHFPSRLYAFVFRCWDLQPVGKIARLLKTDERAVAAVAGALGLPPQPRFTDEILIRNSMPTIFRLWDVLPSEQLLEFMGMTDEEFHEFLNTDIVYAHAIGPQPEGLERLVYREPSAEERSRAASLRNALFRVVPPEKIPLAEEPFSFIADLNRTHAFPLPQVSTTPGAEEVRLDERWKVVAPPGRGSVLQNAVDDFLKFSSVVMGQEIKTAEHRTEAVLPFSITLELALNEFADPESHLVVVSNESIQIRASAEEGVMRALHFLEDEMRLRHAPVLQKGRFERKTQFTPRYIFTYYEMYGDMLKDSVGDFYPETYLANLVHYGINGIWLQGLLSSLAPSDAFPEFGKESKPLITRLNSLIERSQRHGLKVFLYFNEPRAQSEEFYRNHPEARGKWVPSRGAHAMCTSSKMVQQHLSSGFRNLFTLAPGLAGVFVITASENLTNCYSNAGQGECPRCSSRKPHEVISEVINLIEQGVHRAKPEAEVMAWDWSWHGLIEEDPQAETIKGINSRVALMADFERGEPIERGGIKTTINEYCLSVVGPSPRAATRAKQAADKGSRIYAKLTLSTTWEVGSLPYIPVPLQVAKKFVAMKEHGFDGAMESWSVGGYPSLNLEAAKEFYWDPDMTPENAVLRVAARRYGKELAEPVARVWDRLTESFTTHYPFTNGLIYSSPILWGTARNLYFEPLPKPYGKTTIWNSKDDNNWGTNVFPPEVMTRLLRTMAADWFRSAGELKRLFTQAAILERDEVRKDVGIIEAAAIHFESTANQTWFYVVRDRMLKADDEDEKRKLAAELESLVRRELELAVRHYEIARHDSRIGFEAATQYFYRPANILEKIISCQAYLGRTRE